MAKFGNAGPMAPAPVPQGPIATMVPNAFGTKWKNRKATDIMADVTRQEWANYQSTFMPIEDYLADSLNNWGQLTNQAVADSMASVGQSYAGMEQQNDRRLAGYGLSMTPGQRASYNRQMDTQAALDTVNAANRTSQGMEDLRYGVLGGINPAGQGK